MNKQNIYFTILIVLTGVLSLLVLHDFIIVLVLAYIFSTLIKPINVRIQNSIEKVSFLKTKSSILAAFATIILFIVVIVTPITIILSKVVIDTQAVYQNVVNNGVNLSFIESKIQSLADTVSPNLNLNLNKIAQSVSGFFVNNIGAVFSGTVDVILKTFVFILAMFYFLKDGRQFKDLYRLISPLKKESDDKIFASIKQSINSIMIGSLTVAIAQGLATGFGLWLFGVPNPFFFGTLAGFLALIPALGAPLVWVPSAIYLYFTRDGSFAWLYLTIWGVVGVGLIDNILGPKVINKGIKIHPLFILLSIIGGLGVFGPEGFIFGPLVLSIFVSIIKVWNENQTL